MRRFPARTAAPTPWPAADKGKAISVKVSFTDDAGNAETLASAATAAVEAKANSPATGQPAISGTAQVGGTLTADTSGIADEDGLSNAPFAYQWLADGTDIPGATDSTYTLVADDEGKTITVAVSFTDDAGNDESLTGAATDAVEPETQEAQAANNPATGLPTISGIAQVGVKLTADLSGIADEDGVTNAVLAYQWQADGADIPGETLNCYTPDDTDEGKTISVRVTFTDDAGQRGDADQRSHGRGGSPAQPPGHGRAHHNRHGPGGRVADRGRVQHRRCRRAGQNGLRLPVAGR